MMVDLDEVRRVVENADVFTVGFRTFPDRLIVDTRSHDDISPMIRVVEPVATVEERFFWLGKERPAFGVPERFTFFIWPHSIRFFEESGLGDIVRQRVYAVDSDCGPQMAEAMTRLVTLERKAEFDAITGHNYHTLWERTPA